MVEYGYPRTPRTIKKTSLFYGQQLVPPIFHQPLIAWGPVGMSTDGPRSFEPQQLHLQRGGVRIARGDLWRESRGTKRRKSLSGVWIGKWWYMDRYIYIYDYDDDDDDIWICYKYMNDYDYDCIIIPGQCMPNNGKMMLKTIEDEMVY